MKPQTLARHRSKRETPSVVAASEGHPGKSKRLRLSKEALSDVTHLSQTRRHPGGAPAPPQRHQGARARPVSQSPQMPQHRGDASSHKRSGRRIHPGEGRGRAATDRECPQPSFSAEIVLRLQPCKFSIHAPKHRLSMKQVAVAIVAAFATATALSAPADAAATSAFRAAAAGCCCWLWLLAAAAACCCWLLLAVA